ncbi:MAG: hypothetical protein FWD93_00835 [Coriobacteriia bacterium]|nr:hypothetical protein [Coriobacteriia bacterium]
MNAALNTKTTYRVAMTLFVIVVCTLVSIVVPVNAFASTTFAIPVQQIFGATAGVNHPGTFDYELRAVQSTFPLPAGRIDGRYSFALTGSTAQTLSPITFVHAGRFSYDIKSTSLATPGLIIDQSIFRVYIDVRNNAQTGGLDAQIVAVFLRSSEDASAQKVEVDVISFEHAYVAAQSTPGIDPPVVKTVQGNPINADTFTFRLEAQNPNHPMPVDSFAGVKEITIVGSGRAQFGTWAHDAAGVFSYTVKEVPTSNRSYQFDTTVYTITDTVISTGGQLVVDRVVTNDDNNIVSSMSFINTYAGKALPPPPPPPDQQETTPTSVISGITRPAAGPKTGDYTDPSLLIVAMSIAVTVGLMALLLIQWDKRSEKEHGGISVVKV